ncbi:MAG: NAD(P)-dependent oxidoreductase [Rikenellaceae bacterium]
MKILVATEKPFAIEATQEIKQIASAAGFEVVLLEKYSEKSELLAAVKDADAMIVRSDKVTKEVVEAAENLKIVVRAGAGYDNLDLESLTSKGVVAMNTPGQNSNAVAELAIGMMVFMARNCFSPGTGTEISGKRLGIHAYGNVGRLVAKYGKAFGMTIYAYDPFITDKAVFDAEGVIMCSSQEELYSNSDYLSLHIPATAQTVGSINKAVLSLLPVGATLINTARKEVINEAELCEFMAERVDFKYATDIAPANIAELTEKFGKRVFATAKKMGAESAEANVNAAKAAASQIVSFIKDGVTKFKVN